MGFNDCCVQEFRQLDVAVKNAGAVLVGNAQRIAKAFGGDQQRGLALALQQGVGGHGGAHLDAFHTVGGDGLAFFQAQQVAYAGHRSVFVLLGVFAEQFVGDQGAVGAFAHHVGKCAAAVNPELP